MRGGDLSYARQEFFLMCSGNLFLREAETFSHAAAIGASRLEHNRYTRFDPCHARAKQN